MWATAIKAIAGLLKMFGLVWLGGKRQQNKQRGKTIKNVKKAKDAVDDLNNPDERKRVRSKYKRG